MGTEIHYYVLGVLILSTFENFSEFHKSYEQKKGVTINLQINS